MMSAPAFYIVDDPDYGTLVRCVDADSADQFEDYLSEQCYVPFDIKFDGVDTVFYFGQASSRKALEELIARFQADLSSPANGAAEANGDV